MFESMTNVGKKSFLETFTKKVMHMQAVLVDT